MSYDRDWLNILKEFTDPLTGTASLITNLIPGGTGFPDSGDDDFLLYWFMDRAVGIGRSVALLVEHGFYREAGVAARTAVEGQFYLAGYKRDKSLAHKWRYFYIYEGYHEIYADAYRSELIKEHKKQKEQNISDRATMTANAEVAAKAAADKLLDYYRETMGEKVVNEAQALFQPFEQPRQSWYGGRLKRLIDKLREDPGNIPEELPPELEELLRGVVGIDPVEDLLLKYHRLSLVAHWNPSGLINWEGDSNSANLALTATFEYLHTLSTFVNNECKLSFGDALNDIKGRYNQKGDNVLQQRRTK
jgi:hypothetical protein